MDFIKYNTIVFDCDGVVLNSNQVKIQAYYDTAKEVGASEIQAQALVDYHIKLGGISRYVKFEYFIETILNQEKTKQSIQNCLDIFARILDTTLMQCEVAPSLMAFKEHTAHARWMMVSGGDQEEVRTTIQRRHLDVLFEAGIFGSPDNKALILKREVENSNLILPALFLGDSKYDHQASTVAGLDFIFLSGWTDVVGWQDYCQEHQVHVMNNIESLVCD